MSTSLFDPSGRTALLAGSRRGAGAVRLGSTMRGPGLGAAAGGLAEAAGSDL
jgi:hypothetical protein